MATGSALQEKGKKAMNECIFCSGTPIDAEYCGDGIKTMGMMLGMLFGAGKSETECNNGIQLQHGNMLVFDNSAREYAPLSIEIRYCPFCGKELKAEE